MRTVIVASIAFAGALLPAVASAQNPPAADGKLRIIAIGAHPAPA